MLTVKFINRDGDEIIRECFAVVADRTEHDGSPRVLVFDEAPMHGNANHSGIYIDTRDDDEADACTNGIYSGPVLYVMNRHGATVATYHLRRPKPLRMQADPDAIAA